MPLTRIAGVFSPLRPDLADDAALERMTRAMTGSNPPLQQHVIRERGVAMAISALPHVAGEAERNWLADDGIVVAVDGNALGIRGRDDGHTGAKAVLVLAHAGMSPEELDGDFAFAIWDAGSGDLTLAVDPLAKKPIYFFRDASTGLIVFASEARGVLAHPLVPRRPDMDGIALFLRDGHILAPFTAFEGIRKLGLGELRRFGRDGSIGGGVYWRLDDCTDESKSPEHWQEGLRTLLIADARKNLLGRDAAAVFLGGGLDSTAIVGMLSRALGVQTMSVTAGFEPGTRKSEGDFSYSSRVADHYGIEHHEMIVSHETSLPEMPDVYRQMDEPYIPVMNVISGALMLNIIRERGYEVAFNGVSDGELFGPTSVAAIGRDRAAGMVLSDDDARARLFSASYMPAERQNRLTGMNTEHIEALQHAVLQPYRDAVHFTELFNELIAVYKLTSHHGEATQFIERMSALKGVDVRMAFGEWRTLLYALQIPGRFKGYPDPDTHRMLLKGGFADYLPDFVLNRKKSGLPGYVISDHQFAALREELFSPQRIDRAGIFDRDQFLKASKKKQYRKLLSLLMLWFELHIYEDESILERL